MADAMQMPASLPDQFLQYGNAGSDRQLFDALVKNPLELIAFFEAASEDETWTGHEHREFTGLTLEWAEKKALANALPLPITYRIADVIQSHLHVLQPLIALGLTIELKDKQVPTSGLLMISSSDLFRDLIKANAVKGKTSHLTMNMDSHFFNFFNEYIFSGDVEELWREHPETLYRIMEQARKWDLEELASLCETVLKRYIDRTNVFDRLLEAHTNGWLLLKNAAIDLINQMNLGFLLEKGDPHQLICRLQDFKFNTLDSYSKISNEVTRLQFSGRLPEETGFLEALAVTPKLKGLDLTDTLHYTEAYQDLPSTIQELILNHCPWLDAFSLGQFAQSCPKLKKLHLMGNQQLNIAAYAQLQRMPNLQSLKLARCTIKDDAFGVVLAAASHLEDINLEYCEEITPFGFTMLARTSPDLYYIHAAKTQIDNGSLAEIGERCKNLIYMDISHCPNITVKGIQDIIRARPTLRTLIITGYTLSDVVLESIKTDRPQLVLVQ